jgi:hypothetical protein
MIMNFEGGIKAEFSDPLEKIAARTLTMRLVQLK